jgi:hypothetical protein
METAIISIICIALVVFGGMTMSRGFMTSVDTSTMGLEEVGQRSETILRTELSPVSATMPAADALEVVVENTGQVRLADFDKWDFIVHYYDGDGVYHVEWLPYAETPGDNEWNVSWIRLDGAPEVFEPNVLNHGEQVMLRARLDPAAGSGTTNMVVVAAPNGVTVSTYFSP